MLELSLHWFIGIDMNRISLSLLITRFSQFPNVDYAPDIRCPVFIVHGTQDEVVPFWHGEELFLALRQPWRAKPFWVDGAGVSESESGLHYTFLAKLIILY